MAFLAALVIQSPVFAQETHTASLYPTDDAYVDLLATAVNFGSAPLLEVSWSSAQTSAGQNILQIDHLAYLKFDLSLSNDSIIQSAFLKLYVTKAVAGSSILIVLPEKDSAWTEATITAKNAPDIPSSRNQMENRAIDSVKIKGLKTWFSLDVTSYARSVRSGPLSFIVAGGNQQSPWRDIIQFYSKESPDPALRPYLEVAYSGTEVQTGGGPAQSIVYLTLRSSVAGGSVYFNDTEYKIPNSLEVILDVPTGRYKIGASPTISISDRAKAVFQKWNDSSPDNPREIEVSKSITLEAKYFEQYYVNVTTQYGAATGTGWYGSGSTATLGVSGDPGANPPRVQAEGVLGLFGMSYVFDHWSGYPTPGSSLKIGVDAPLTVTAIWTQDYSLFYSYLIRGALSLGAGFVAAIVVRRKVLGAHQRTGIGDQLRTGPEHRRRSAPAQPSIERTHPAPVPVPRTAATPVRLTNPSPSTRAAKPSPTEPPPFTRAAKPAPVPLSARTVVPVLSIKFCRECGVKIPRDSIYCEECGKKLA